ncbi:hypothetical protein LTR66_008844 [Elasticomyces elasticus]|nr:hypothetical protein LTR66_008844 [Elasticomyces elasticus]
MEETYYLGKRLSLNGNRCTVRYVGEVQGKSGQWLGVEWDDPARGKNDGTNGGVRYFDCLSKAKTPASFLRPKQQWDPPVTFLGALRAKYAPEVTHVVQNIRISGKEAEEIGFVKIRRQQAHLQNLRTVVVDGMRIAMFDRGVGGDASDIRQTCPNVTELDLSRNLLETWSNITQITSSMPALTSLSASNNNLGCLTDFTPTSTLTTITLENNAFEKLTDLSPLAKLRLLQKLVLKNNQISAIPLVVSSDVSVDSTSPVDFASTVYDIDVSSNQILSWSFINALPSVFPGLTHLRVSYNPLYYSLISAEGKPLTAEDGYMLTIARLPRLRYLNYSAITGKERLNAETYYLSQIAVELADNPPEREADVLAQHPRYAELCEEYGEPAIARAAKDLINPNSLAARLISFVFQLSPIAVRMVDNSIEPIWKTEIPKSFSIYNVLGMVGKHYGMPPMQLRLVLETGEQDPAARKMGGTYQVDEWDSSDEEVDATGGLNAREGIMWVEREEEMVAGSRAVGTYVEGTSGKVRVERK